MTQSEKEAPVYVFINLKGTINMHGACVYDVYLEVNVIN